MRKACERSSDVALGATCIVLLALTLFVGCSPDVVGVSGEAHDHEAEHHVPSHFPGNAVAAIERLEALLGAETAHPTTPSGAESGVTPRKEVYDLARWLPELAAETELDEATWNQVRDASRALGTAAERATGDAAPTGADVAAAMEALSPIPQSIRAADIAYRRQRGLDDFAEVAAETAEEPSSPTTGPES